MIGAVTDILIVVVAVVIVARRLVTAIAKARLMLNANHVRVRNQVQKVSLSLRNNKADGYTFSLMRALRPLKFLK